jgi:hypothetical protein
MARSLPDLGVPYSPILHDSPKRADTERSFRQNSDMAVLTPAPWNNTVGLFDIEPRGNGLGLQPGSEYEFSVLDDRLGHAGSRPRSMLRSG